jgi:hypothetical protein
MATESASTSFERSAVTETAPTAESTVESSMVASVPPEIVFSATRAAKLSEIAPLPEAEIAAVTDAVSARIEEVSRR